MSISKIILFLLSGVLMAGFAMYMNMTEQDWTQILPTSISSHLQQQQFIKSHTSLADIEQLKSKSLYDFSVLDSEGSSISMKNYSGKVLLIVNTASYCGFTPQFASLQRLYERFNGQGFEVLAFPCNQFGAQEPGNREEFCSFATEKYNVSFKLFDKIKVNGPDAAPLFRFLKSQARGFLTNDIKWNFTKFLVDRSGKLLEDIHQL